jgi:hypothetical protein
MLRDPLPRWEDVSDPGEKKRAVLVIVLFVVNLYEEYPSFVV